MLSLEGSVITIDTMGTQTAIAEKIVDGGAGYILALKGNQGTLLQDVRLMENEVLPMSELHTPHPQPLGRGELPSLGARHVFRRRPPAQKSRNVRGKFRPREEILPQYPQA